MANWELIKKEYCTGIPPRELELKHNVKAKTISERAAREEWTQEKAKISKEIADNFDKEVKNITTLALQRLTEMLLSKEVKDTDLISAIGKSLDISGLKSQKIEQTNIDTTPFEVKIVK